MIGGRLVSVVVPVWGAEKWLDECVESLVKQTLSDIEIILVDDGSKDRSGVMCDEWVNRDGRIKVFHQDNCGANIARWNGVLQAKGEWVAFCDADDRYELDGLERMYQAAIEGNETDLVIAFFEKPHLDKWLDLDECRKSVLGEGRFPSSLCAKMYRLSLLTNDIFDISREIIIGEDAIVNTRVLFKTNRNPHIVFDKVYEYRRNKTSISHNECGGLDAQELFYTEQHRYISSQDYKKFLKSIVKYKLNGLIDSACSEPEALIAEKHPFLVQLRDEISESDYKMNLHEWLLMNMKCRMGLKVLNFAIRARNSLKYRMGLNN